LDTLPWGDDAFHLVVTHSHSVDQDLVATILPKRFAWLGMIGSRSKVAKFFLRFKAAGIDEDLFSRLSSPVGLDINAETPHEIAISILAELIRIKRNATQQPLPLSDQPIEARGGDGQAHPPALRRE
jgi:xanthine dehydrogenase accessory factor